MVKKKERKLDTRLFIVKNIMKTVKYYFKNIFYILFMNFIVFYIFNVFFKEEYTILLLKIFDNGTFIFKLFYYGIFLIIFYTIKMILYGNTTYIMKKGAKNDIKDLLSIVLRRFLPTFGTFILYIFSVIFFSILLLIPGIMFAFYFFFAMFLCSVGDINEENKLLNGAKALGRSYHLVKGNLIRFIFTTSIIIFLIFFIEELIIIVLNNIFGLQLSNFVLQGIKFTAFDIVIIYASLLFNKLEGIENDILEEKAFKKDKREELMMRAAAVNQFKK